MVREFEIIHVIIHHNRGLILFAKYLGPDEDFTVPEGSVLREIRIYHYKDMPPFTDDNGHPRKGIFVFRPFDIERFFDKSFEEGEKVTLITPDVT